jgi:hypothetical protein
MQFPSAPDPLAYDTRHQNYKNKIRHFAVSTIQTASQTFVTRFNFFYLAGNLHDLRGRWVAYSLICRQNKDERNPSTDQ